MSSSWTQNVQDAFQRDADLRARVLDVAGRYPGEVATLLGDIAAHLGAGSTGILAPNSKKRKLDDAAQPAPATNGSAHRPAGVVDPVVSFECKDVSFQVPARKKLRLQVVSDGVDSRQKEVRLLGSQTGETEFALSSGQIDQIFCLPVPEKQQRQWSFCIFPQAGAVTADGAPCEQLVFTMAETKPVGIHAGDRAVGDEDTFITFTEPELNRLLQPYGKRVVWPTETEFASSIPQPHRKGEKAYHVKAHRGTKDGYLFFLPNGIVFGFKKPLSFFPFSVVQSISYTSVLQRTFNLVISVMEGDGTEVKDTEFSMLDQADFAGIDGYIKRHGLNDASMAADRRAKEYNVNKENKRGEANGDAPAAENGEDEQTELQKAEQQLQDEEDELEEDYEASGGESDGEGEYSDELSEAGEEYGDEYDEDDDEGDDEETKREGNARG